VSVCVCVEGGSQGREGELVQSRIKNILLVYQVKLSI